MSPIPRSAATLGYAGLIPFAGLALLSITGAGQAFSVSAILTAFIAYSAVIASFLGGIRWGVGGVQQGAADADFWISIGVSLAAWVCLLLPTAWAVSGLLLVHVVTGLIDQVKPPAGQQPWLKSLRLKLSAGAVLAHLAAGAGLLLH